jgi:hypothetical protein
MAGVHRSRLITYRWVAVLAAVLSQANDRSAIHKECQLLKRTANKLLIQYGSTPFRMRSMLVVFEVICISSYVVNDQERRYQAHACIDLYYQNTSIDYSIGLGVRVRKAMLAGKIMNDLCT